MDFRRLTEGECGQSNPLQQLANHVTSDRAHQERIGYSLTHTQGNPMPPQTFRMDELMQELQAVESPMVSVPPTMSSATNRLGTASWVEEYNSQFNSSVLPNPIFELPSPQFPSWRCPRAPPPLYSEQMTEYVQFHPLQTEISLQTEIGEPQTEFMGLSYSFNGPEFWAHLDNMQNISSQIEEEPKEEEPKEDEPKEEEPKEEEPKEEEPNEEKLKEEPKEEEPREEEPKEEASSEDETSIAKPLIYWDGFGVEDELGVTNLSLSRPRLFYEFEKAYRYHYCYPENPDEIKNIHSIDSEFKLQKLISNTPYKYSKDNPMFKLSDAYEEGENAMNDNAIAKAILCFEAAVQKDPHNIDKLFKLCEALLRNQKPRSALSVANQILELAPNHPIPHYCKVMIYNNQKCDYQTCQSVFNWLMCHNSYRDIIPPHFKMEDKTTTDLDEDTLIAVTKMLIKAAQQNPINLDLEVQYLLGILCIISGEYDKAVDCLRLMLSKTNPKSRQANSTKLKISECLFFANKPEQSLALLLKQTKTLEFEDYQRIGFIYMYLKKYKQAAYYLTTSLNKKYTSTVSDFEMYREDAARLSLCLEFICRQECGGTPEDFEKNFPAFLRSYYKKHILVHNIIFPNPTQLKST